MPKVSVVVAIYKVESYLEQCLRSIDAQTYKDLEIILVDDGSPDNCPLICDQFAKQDKRIKVIHQENQGSVMARYNGALAATGEYLSFIDGDDWLEPNMYEEMAKLAESCDADVVITGYLTDDAAVSLPKRNNMESGIYTGERLEEFWHRALFDGKYYEFGVVPALWNKLLRRTLVMEVGHPHPLIKMGDDAAVSYPVMARAKTIIVDNDKQFYHYRVVQNSMSRSFDPLYFERALYLLDGLKRNLMNNIIIQEKLVYYALFISQIGIEQTLSRKCSTPFCKIESVISNYRKRLLAVFSDDEKISWDSFNLYVRLLLKYFWRGKIGRMIVIRYMMLFCRKMKISSI